VCAKMNERLTQRDRQPRLHYNKATHECNDVIFMFLLVPSSALERKTAKLCFAYLHALEAELLDLGSQVKLGNVG